MRHPRVLPRIDPPNETQFVPFSGNVLTVREACEKFKLSRTRLSALMNSGEVVVRRLGYRTVLVCEESVRAYLRGSLPDVPPELW
jgi:hypothetical protein